MGMYFSKQAAAADRAMGQVMKLRDENRKLQRQVANLETTLASVREQLEQERARNRDLAA